MIFFLSFISESLNVLVTKILCIIPATAQHIIKILKRYKDNETIWAWDLKNEADLDFPAYGKETVLEWLTFITDIARREAPHHYLTVGWSTSDVAHLLDDQLDIISFHSYKNIGEEQRGIEALKTKVQDKEMFISEFGKTSYRSWLLPFGSTENEQALYCQKMLELMEDSNIRHFAYWTLHDYEKAPSEVFGWKPWIKKSQEQMGIIRENGDAKKVYRTFENLEGTAFRKTISDYCKPFYLIATLFLLLFILIIGRRFR